jgi:hypothetical protein
VTSRFSVVEETRTLLIQEAGKRMQEKFKACRGRTVVGVQAEVDKPTVI